MFYLICAWINGGVNSREAGELRRHHAHYDITVMWFGPDDVIQNAEEISSGPFY